MSHQTTPDIKADYDPNAIFLEDGPIDPWFMADAIQAIMRACPLNRGERYGAQQRHMQAALVALAATNPRDPIEVMLAVQAQSAYQAACVCWHIGMNAENLGSSEKLRHMASAASMARTFDTMLRGLERRQAKPLSIPVGRPEPKLWQRPVTPDIMQDIAGRIGRMDAEPAPPPPPPEPKPPIDPAFAWSAEALQMADDMLKQVRIDKDNEGLDIANTEGILPCGGMIVMDDPTPNQIAYMGRRLALMYRREYDENLRQGINKYPRIRGIRTGDLIP